jgi:hypothetical protein
MPEHKEQVIATLIFESDYMHQLNQVASITDRNVVFLKRKFASKAGYELAKYSLADCLGITYSEERPLGRMIFGALLTALIVSIFVMIGIYWNDLEPGTRIKIGLFALAGFYGVRLLLGARMNRLVFKMRDGSALEWKSRPGAFKYTRDAALKVEEFAKQKGLAR